jgi:hypothetical protein
MPLPAGTLSHVTARLPGASAGLLAVTVNDADWPEATPALRRLGVRECDPAWRYSRLSS